MCNFVETASQGVLDLQACYQVERKGKARSRIGAGVKANDAYIYIFEKKVQIFSEIFLQLAVPNTSKIILFSSILRNQSISLII